MKQSEFKKRLLPAFETIVKVLKDSGYDTDIDKGNFEETPKRAAKALAEIILTPEEIRSQVDLHLSKTFDSLYRGGMIIQRGFTVISMCPHHLLPIIMTVTVGYIPNSKVLGLSKIIRLGQLLGKQPILQEDFTYKLAYLFMDSLLADGVGVYVEGKHGCMVCRGVMQNSPTITTTLLGSFLSNKKVKSEFMSYIK